MLMSQKFMSALEGNEGIVFFFFFACGLWREEKDFHTDVRGLRRLLFPKCFSFLGWTRRQSHITANTSFKGMIYELGDLHYLMFDAVTPTHTHPHTHARWSCSELHGDEVKAHRIKSRGSTFPHLYDQLTCVQDLIGCVGLLQSHTLPLFQK